METDGVLSNAFSVGGNNKTVTARGVLNHADAVGGTNNAVTSESPGGLGLNVAFADFSKSSTVTAGNKTAPAGPLAIAGAVFHTGPVTQHTTGIKINRP